MQLQTRPQFHGWIRSRLLSVSAATLDRLLRPVRLQHPNDLSATWPGTLLKSQILIRTEHWDITQPGFVEADTGAHCGHSLAGDFDWSLTLSDIDTGWTECRATRNKGAHGVVAHIKAIERALPFTPRGVDSDNASGFLNHHLLHYFAGHPHHLPSPIHAPTRTTPMPPPNKTTGATSASCSATTASRMPSWPT